MRIPELLKTPGPRALKIIKILIFTSSLLPLARLLWGFYADALGANPIETITRSTGEWALIFLTLSLSVTPLRKWSGLNWLIRLRRMLGVYAFFYALLHFMTYLWLDQFFDWSGIAGDIVKRPFITAGFAAFVLMLPLAATSFNAAIRALGGKRWQALHRSAYAIAIIGVVHYWWLVKIDIREPLFFALSIAALLGARAYWREQERKAQLLSKTPIGTPQKNQGKKTVIPIHAAAPRK